MTTRLVVTSVRAMGRAKVAVARLLGSSVGEAEALLRNLPAVLPLYFERSEAEAVRGELAEAGVLAAVEEVVHPAKQTCQTHARLVNDGSCSDCGEWICGVCRAVAVGKRVCPVCATKHRRAERFRRLRVALLLLVLLGVVGWAFNKSRKRAMRTEWKRPVRVALVLVEREAVDVDAVDALRSRMPAFEDYLAAEAGRYGVLAEPPIDFDVLGPVPNTTELPTLPIDAGFLDAARHKFRLDAFFEPIDASLTTNPSQYDARIYLLVRSVTGDDDPRFVEGIAELGGELGLVEIDLAEDTVDLALLASAHELFHILGASDKYRLDGSVIVPEGLADPYREPLFPQEQAEIMARTIPENERKGVLPGAFDQVVVGTTTAVEIGWARPGDD